MSAIQIQYYLSPFGEMELGVYGGKLCLCNWRNKKNKALIHKRLQNALKADFIELPHPVHQQTTVQLDRYFNHQLKQFELPLLLTGSDFQKQVWQLLLTIPYGTTISYQQLAAQMGKPKGYRAVANADAANAHSIIVPCHRVIGSQGQLTGYAGGLATKQALLQLETD